MPLPGFGLFENGVHPNLYEYNRTANFKPEALYYGLNPGFPKDLEEDARFTKAGQQRLANFLAGNLDALPSPGPNGDVDGGGSRSPA